jgi:hypothetical protein
MSRTQLTNDNISAGGAAYTSTSNPSATTNTVNGLTLAVGQVWLNTATGQMYSCTDATADANVWIPVGVGTGGVPFPSGGVITTDGDFKVHTFNSSGVFGVASLDGIVGNTVEYLVIAGGGGGGDNRAAGGGAGGYRTASGFSVTAQNYTITVGAGGPHNNRVANTDSENGTNSIFSTITSIGGGGANWGQNLNGNPGGSGSGGSSETSTGGLGTAGQGNNGGNANSSPGGGGGGGGGAGSVGGASSSGNGGNGGTGLSSDIQISGTNVIRAGGGGGGASTPGSATGGGAAGVNNSDAINATVNKGGGGGGAWDANGSSGGSGVVIIRYRFQTS